MYLTARVAQLEQLAGVSAPVYAIAEYDARGQPSRAFIADAAWRWHERPVAELEGAVVISRLWAGA